MARIFSSVDEVRRLPDSPLKEILLNDLEPKPQDCRAFRDVLECADTTAILVEPGDDIHHFREGGSGPLDLVDFENMYYESIEVAAGGRMIIAAELGTRYYLPTELLSAADLALFLRRAQSSTPTTS